MKIPSLIALLVLGSLTCTSVISSSIQTQLKYRPFPQLKNRPFLQVWKPTTRRKLVKRDSYKHGQPADSLEESLLSEAVSRSPSFAREELVEATADSITQQIENVASQVSVKDLSSE